MARVTRITGADGTIYELPPEKGFEKYEVGDIFTTTREGNAADLLGYGEWELIEDRTLIGAGGLYTVGQTGGEKEVVLTIAQMPEHDHRDGTDAGDGISGSPGGSTAIVYWNAGSGRPTTKTGGSQPHNNMPPFYAVYHWLRTA